jgi:ribosomal protein L37E
MFYDRLGYDMEPCYGLSLLRCRRCGGERMIPLTFPDDETESGFGRRSLRPTRPTAKCVDCGLRHSTRLTAINWAVAVVQRQTRK